jgi:transcriptional regulator with XRE-family HTH domain
MNFNDWINCKYIEWRGSSRKTVTEFSEYIGISQSLMSHWMSQKGKIPTSQEKISKLVNRYGNEVYKVLGLPIPQSDSLLDALPSEIRESLEPALKEINSIYAREKVSPDSSHALRIAEEVFSKYGFTVNDKI